MKGGARQVSHEGKLLSTPRGSIPCRVGVYQRAYHVVCYLTIPTSIYRLPLDGSRSTSTSSRIPCMR